MRKKMLKKILRDPKVQLKMMKNRMKWQKKAHLLV